MSTTRSFLDGLEPRALTLLVVIGFVIAAVLEHLVFDDGIKAAMYLASSVMVPPVAARALHVGT